MTEYSPPLDKLLTLGDCRELRTWPNYLEFGLTAAHIPDLIRLVADSELHQANSENPAVWGSVHAWRALGQLRAEAAIEPLMSLFHELEEDDWFHKELPEVYSMIGPAAIPALKAYLSDPSHDLFPRVTASSSLARIATEHPEARDECISVLTQELEKLKEHDPEFNGFLIASLCDLQATESAATIQRAFAVNSVDPSIAGDWEDVQVALGLKEARETPREYGFSPVSESGSFADSTTQQLNAAKKARSKAKGKKKMARQSRKKNRKKRK